MGRLTGREIERADGAAKAAGAARYVDDLRWPGMLYGRTIRSTVARGTLGRVSLEFDL